MEWLKYLIVSLRPKQWIKNFFVVAPLFFSQRMMEGLIVARVGLAFGLFCLFSSSMYLFNDVIDLAQDRNHPQKARRPLAAGLLSVKSALLSALILLSVAILASLILGREFLLICLVYCLLNFLYTFYLKRIVIIDVICIALGFVLRVVAGGIAVEVTSSRWILVTTIFLSLFLGFAKRRGEIALVSAPRDLQRFVLRDYSIQLLDDFLVICATASIISYALFTLSDYALQRFATHNLIYTIPFVLFGVFRYFYLVHSSSSNENPTQVLFSDKPLIINIILWVICVIIIVYS